MAPMNAFAPLAFPGPSDSGSIPSMPHNLEAEQALLGSLMFDNAVFERLSDRLRGSHFYEPFHQRLYEAIEDHIRQGMLAEPTILMERFKQDPAFQEFGGLRYLADLVDRAPPAANAPERARPCGVSGSERTALASRFHPSRQSGGPLGNRVLATPG